MPAEVEVRGETIDLPPIRLRMLAEIKSVSPAEGAAVDLREAVFRWSPIPNAATYRVQFCLEYTATNVVGGAGTGIKSLASVQTTSTSLGLDLLSEKVLNIVPQELVRGRTGIWIVEAYDANHVQIGKTYGRGASFLVARGLTLNRRREPP